MIRTLGENGTKRAIEIAGTPETLAREAAVMVQAIYNTLGPVSGRQFKAAFIEAYRHGTLWKQVPVQDHTPYRRPGPHTPKQ